MPNLTAPLYRLFDLFYPSSAEECVLLVYEAAAAGKMRVVIEGSVKRIEDRWVIDGWSFVGVPGHHPEVLR